jgi:crotonobetainyl-CoA:carnitine CoA-transferase CaiB-like acyl-CoA transferase
VKGENPALSETSAKILPAPGLLTTICLLYHVLLTLVASDSKRYGIGQEVKTSLYGSQLWSQRWSITHVGMTGAELKRQGKFAYAVSPGGSGVYRSSDGRFLCIMFPIVGNDADGAWKALCNFARRPDLEHDQKGVPAWRGVGNKGTGEPAEEVAAFRKGLEEMIACCTMLVSRFLV